MEEKIIKEFKVIEHFVNKGFNVECGLYEIRTEREHYFIVQTKNDYKAISHSLELTKFYPVTEVIIQEIKELLNGIEVN